MNFVRDGNFTFGFRTLLCFLGVGIIAGAILFVESKFWFYVVVTLGLVVGYLGGYAAQAAVLRLKPFTNDPLGWRAAKASYEVKQSKDDGNQKGCEK